MRPPKKLEANKNQPVDLSDFVFLSKTVQGSENENLPGLDVETHCRITGYVASKILSLFPEKLYGILFVKAAPLAAAAHDIGKINPDFQKMIYEGCSAQRDVMVKRAIEKLQSMGADSSNAKRKGRSFHAKVTQIVLNKVRPELKKYIAVIEGMHHGFRPIDSTPYSEEIYGEIPWIQARHGLLEKLESEFGTEGIDCRAWQDIQSWNEACIVGGLIIVADWIASGGQFACLKNMDRLSHEKLIKMAENAVREAGFHKLSVKQGLSFEAVFGFIPRNVQKTFFDAVTGPGVYVLEAPMGLGKTEAALYAAYKVLSAGLASGLYFALPTQLTSNKIYERVESFLEKILFDTDLNNRLQLLHGAAWMERTFGEDGDIGKSWFDGSKRGILAPFAVGTVDQALMSVMDVKHSMVRAFGLAGKVVILDEIHSYDAYTGTILNALVESLRLSACTVILLSATLTSRQKSEILNVRNAGNFNQAYPLVTFSSSQVKKSDNPCRTSHIESGCLKEIAVKATEGNRVSVSFCRERAKAVESALEKASGGQQVLWIENTVQDAQDVFRLVAARCGKEIDCGLIHSRFERIRRTENEAHWVSLYGSGGKIRRYEKGRILVGTQVLEQSLDIDADFLITALCPTDMLLQRMGRLWRHAENTQLRPAGAECSCMVLAPDFDSVLSEHNAFGVSGAVYSEYVLCRTYELWKDRSSVSLPGDIRNLLEETYSEREESGLWKSYKDDMVEKKSRLEQFARFTKSKELSYDNTKTESQVQTRYSEQDTVSVLLLHSCEEGKSAFKVHFVSGESIFIPRNAWELSANERIKKSKVLMEHCVTVAEKNAPLYEKKLEIFKGYIYTGSNEDDHPFRCAIVGDDTMLRTMQKLPCGCEQGLRFYYNQELGYQVKKDGI